MISKIYKAISQNKKPRILLIGDVMLDEQINGDASRISAEAPVPVLLFKNKTYYPGGAANVAMNLFKMQADVALISVTGGDNSHNTLKNLLKNKIDTKFLIDDERPTTTKTRIISDRHQVTRIDTETSKNISSEAENELIRLYDKRLDSLMPDVVVVSDYGKGVLTHKVCSHVIKTAKALDIPVMVDPKGKKYDKYAGATLITPNRKELQIASEAYELNELIIKAQEFCLNLNINNIALTRSEEGISLISSSSHVHFPTVAEEVVDVCGAGDAVISAAAIGIGLGLEIDEAVFLGNLAGAAAVKKHGTQAVSRLDLIKTCIEKNKTISTNKVFSLSEIENIAALWKEDKQKIVFTNGCFDLFHVGHLSLLKKCKELGTKLIVGLNTDNSIKKLKGENRPVITENERAQILSGLECVDAVVFFEDDTPLRVIQSVFPNVLVKGKDYQSSEIVGADFVIQNQGKVVTVDLIEGISTTKILEKISKKD